MKVSIVIPTWNGDDVVAECLRGVFEQEVDFEVEVLVIDSSSSDRTPDLARRFPIRVHSIPQREFSHGDTRNLGARMTDGDLIVFLVQDAYPERRDWLCTLVGNFVDPLVAGAFSRVVPRRNAGPLVRRGVQGDLNFGEERLERQVADQDELARLDPLTKRIFANFNDVASCLRRDVWRRLPFPRVSFGEDLLWALGALQAGYKIVFDPDAPVVHSHEYDPKTLRARTRIDGWVNRAYLDRVCVARRRDAWIMTKRVALEDRRYVRGLDLSRGERRRLGFLSYYYHWLEFLGAYEGGRTKDRLVAPVISPDRPLRILFVVHGFPPESVAGTEVLTLALAQAHRRRGHHVAVFFRSGDPAAEDHSLAAGEIDGMTTYRVVNQLDYRSIRDTVANPPIEARFREVLARERPDVVHFEHMIHLSVALPRICREAGVAAVVTLNDFWFRCARVQLVRPNQKLCSGPPPILGCAACISNVPALVGPLRAVSRPLRRLCAVIARHAAPLLPAKPKHVLKQASNLVWLALRPETMNEALGQAHFIIAPSPFLKEKMVEAGVPPERIVVSDYGMENGWLARYERRPAPGRVRFGFVGSLVWYKGLEVLARAFERIDDPRAELHVHGDDDGRPEFADVRRRAEAIVRRDGLLFHGRYEPGRIGEVLSGIDVLVVPSVWYENSPLAIHEAFLARIPVIVSDLGGMRNLVVEGRGGTRFRAGDDADLARVMGRFLEDATLADRVAAAAPPVKTTDENAAEMEVKYRQAIGLVAGAACITAVDLRRIVDERGLVEAGQDGSVRIGPSRPGGSSVEYAVDADGAMDVELRIVLACDPADAAAEQGVQVTLNGRRVATLAPSRPASSGASIPALAPVSLHRGRNRLVLSTWSPNGADAALARVRAISVLRTPAARRPD